MNAIKLRLDSTSQLRWPGSCAYCGSPAENIAPASISTSKDFRYYGVVLKWSNQRLSLRYPVCRKHGMLCRLLDLPASWGFIDASLRFLFIPTALWIASTLIIATTTGLKGDDLDPYTVGTGILFFGATLALYLGAVTIKPVKLLDVHQNTITVLIRNERFFRELSALNPEIATDS